MDKRLFNGGINAFHSRYFKYRGKAYVLTKDLYFPPHSSANKSVRMGPEGELLAIGGDLEPDRMIHAFKNGVYPLFFNDQLFLWWTSEIRCVMSPKDIHIPSNMKKLIRKNNFQLTVDKAFHDVVRACSESRKDFTWLTPEREASCFELHELGLSHSVEVWQDEKLVGGLFGIAVGSYFLSESMFTRVSNASKLAKIALCLRLGEMNFSMVDSGFWPTDHAKRLGAVIIPRDEFLGILDKSVQTPDVVEKWEDLFKDWDFRSAAENHIAEEQFIDNSS